jgi:hypothetical protein
VAATKRQAAATLGAMLPDAKPMPFSWEQRAGDGTGRCSAGQAAGSKMAVASAGEGRVQEAGLGGRCVCKCVRGAAAVQQLCHPYALWQAPPRAPRQPITHP